MVCYTGKNGVFRTIDLSRLPTLGEQPNQPKSLVSEKELWDRCVNESISLNSHRSDKIAKFQLL